MYWLKIGPSVKPNVSFSASIDSLFNFPLNCANIIDAGSPGIKRGIIKLRVIAIKPAKQ